MHTLACDHCVHLLVVLPEPMNIPLRELSIKVTRLAAEKAISLCQSVKEILLLHN